MRVVVTRPAAQAESLIAALRAAGFDVVRCPLIETEPLGDGAIDAAGYDWVIVTSANGAHELGRRGVRPLPPIAAVGDATAAALAEEGLDARFIPAVTSQEGVLDEFPQPVGRALFVGAEGARPLLAEELPADFRPAYRTVELSPEPPEGELVLLTSPSAARAWARLAVALPAITIGPQTTAAARAANVDVVAEAATADVAGLVDSAAAWRASSRS
jgi:uroporphyrinogen-III synthase